LGIHVAEPLVQQEQVGRPIAEHLVGEVQVAASRIPGLGDYPPLATERVPEGTTGISRSPGPFLTAAKAQIQGISTYLAMCDAWQVPPADEATSEPVGGSHPLLVFVGEFDSFEPHVSVVESLSDRQATYVLQVTAQTYNVLGFSDCALTIRNAWVDRPDAPPADTSCLAVLTISFAEPR
jgi:hypothetical protein